ncbi:HRDC domain-containing protein [Deinococcus sp. QL22]|uniref:HRDC domain-containing protein n=1 Tax=Deinococcus sp. QL22 TaxID=2939437 RepID=UPI0020182D3B|nr:HRDC domain-containing protein [Deinococcus sp. QL22]UQN07619.1 HRDC domain-containing protein [Deinococcus sp. QL22]
MTDSRFVASSPRPDNRPDLPLVSLHTVRGDPHVRLAGALAALEGADWGLLLGGDAALARQLAAILGGGTLRVDSRLSVNRDALAGAGLAVASLDADWNGARAVWLMEPDARTLERAARAGVRVIVDATLAPGGGWPTRGADLVVYRDGVTLTGHSDGTLAVLFGTGRAPMPAAPAPADLTVALALRDVATLPLRLARAARTTLQLAERLGGTALEAGPTALLLAPDAAADTFSAPGGVMAAARSVPAGVLLTPGLQDLNAVLALLRSETEQPGTPTPLPNEQWNARDQSVPAPVAAEAEARDPEPQDAPAAEQRSFAQRDGQRDGGQQGGQRRGRQDGRRDDGRRGERNSQNEPRRFERPRVDQPRTDQPRPDQARADQTRPDSDAPPERFTFDAPDNSYADNQTEAAPTQTAPTQAAAPAVAPTTHAPEPTFAVPSAAHDEVWEPEIVFSDTPKQGALTDAVHRQSEKDRGEELPEDAAVDAVQAEAQAAQDDAEQIGMEADAAGSFAEALAEFEQTEAGQEQLEQAQVEQTQLEQTQAPAPLILAPDLPPTPPATQGTDAERPDPTADLTPEQAAIYARLRDWRNAEAKRQDMSRFIVASNATIAEIARRVPYTAADLKAVRGMGPERLRKYGEKILEVVRG